MKTEMISALMELFAMAYHSREKTAGVFEDLAAGALIYPDEWELIRDFIYKAALKKDPSLEGYIDQAVRKIVNGTILPYPLSMTLFTERALNTASIFGVSQYVMIGSGYNTFAYRQGYWSSAMEIFELSKKDFTDDKIARLISAGIRIPENVHYVDYDGSDFSEILTQNAAFSRNKATYYCVRGKNDCLNPEKFSAVMASLEKIASPGSGVTFCYDNTFGIYDFRRVQRLMEKYGFLIYEHVGAFEMDAVFFSRYNGANPLNEIHAPENIGYCLAVKK